MCAAQYRFAVRADAVGRRRLQIGWIMNNLLLPI